MQPPEEWLYTVSRDSVQQDRAEMSHCFQLPPALLSGDDLRAARFGVSTFIGFNNSQVLIPVNGTYLFVLKHHSLISRDQDEFLYAQKRLMASISMRYTRAHTLDTTIRFTLLGITHLNSQHRCSLAPHGVT